VRHALRIELKQNQRLKIGGQPNLMAHQYVGIYFHKRDIVRHQKQ
jgi:hypothetical protein